MNPTRRGWLVVAVLAAGSLPAAPPVGSTGAGFFGIEARGRKFVYVLDRSASMGVEAGVPLDTAKRELVRSLDALGGSQQFHLVFYNQRVTVFAPGSHRGRPIFADDDMKAAARRFIDGIRADGGTRHHEALVTALRLRPDVVFLLTDADAGDDLTADEAARLSRDVGSTTLHVVQFATGEEVRSPRLERLALGSGGRYERIDPTAADR